MKLALTLEADSINVQALNMGRIVVDVDGVTLAELINVVCDNGYSLRVVDESDRTSAERTPPSAALTGIRCSTAGLPNASELVDMVYEYCRKRGLYPDAESYPWKSNAHYWLVTNLYQNMRANALTDAELRRKAADELSCMTARINRGEAIPEPVKQLPVMGGRPLNRAQALAKIAEIKAKFGLKGARV